MPAVRQVSRSDDVTLAILAGGEGSRMGMPKAQLTIDSRPILDYLLDEITWPEPTMLVTAPGREHPPGWMRFTREVVDPVAGGGPLRGVVTAIEHVTTPLLLVLTVDMPAIRLTQCDFLIDRLREDPSALGIMMRRTVDDAALIEPFPCALRSQARPVAARRLADNRRSIHGLLEEPRFVAVDAPASWDNRTWTNLNAEPDLIAFTQFVTSTRANRNGGDFPK